MNSHPDQSPEGKLIKNAANRRGLSLREAARQAGISYGRWRQIVTGYQNVSPGSYAAVRAPAGTLARMATVAGVQPDELEQAGRADAAEAMRSMIPSHQDDDRGSLSAGDETSVLPAVATAIGGLVASLTPAIEVEVRRARMRTPDAMGADIFTNMHEARIWDLDLPEPRRVGIVAFLRATRTQREAAAPDTSRHA